MTPGWITTTLLDNDAPGGWAVARSREGFLHDTNGPLFPREWLKRQDLPVFAEHGIGHLDAGGRRRSAGLGLTSIDERTRILAGEWRIGPSPLGGTRLEVAIPNPAPARPQSGPSPEVRHD